jgi:LysR substrate binding domain
MTSGGERRPVFIRASACLIILASPSGSTWCAFFFRRLVHLWGPSWVTSRPTASIWPSPLCSLCCSEECGKAFGSHGLGLSAWPSQPSPICWHQVRGMSQWAPFPALLPPAYSREGVIHASLPGASQMICRSPESRRICIRPLRKHTAHWRSRLTRRMLFRGSRHIVEIGRTDDIRPALELIDARSIRPKACFARVTASLASTGNVHIELRLGRSRTHRSSGRQQAKNPNCSSMGIYLPRDPREIGTGVYDQVIELCQRAGSMPHVAQEARETPTVVGLVAAGLGLGIVPSSLRSVKVKGVRYRPLEEKEARSSHLEQGLVYSGRRPPERGLLSSPRHANAAPKARRS